MDSADDEVQVLADGDHRDSMNLEGLRVWQSQWCWSGGGTDRAPFGRSAGPRWGGNP